MPRYEVKFFVDLPTALGTAEEAALAHNVHAAITGSPLAKGNPKIKPEGRKVYVRREYSPQEEREIVRKHGGADKLAGRKWEDPAQGCSCSICREYRALGAVL